MADREIMTGRLFGIGVGPGDPELLTLKAVRLIQHCAVIAYPAPADGAESMARRIAADHIPAGKTEIVISTPMTPGNFPANDVYDKYAAEIAGHLDTGRDVAVLCEGDPFLFGSFMYLFGRLSADYPTEVVPGVSSLGACAACSGRPLVSRNQVLTIVPAPIDESRMREMIAGSDAVAIMKVGRHLQKVRRVLAELGCEDNATYIERATLDEEKVLPLTEMAADTAPYFSMILVRRAEGADA